MINKSFDIKNHWDDTWIELTKFIQLTTDRNQNHLIQRTWKLLNIQIIFSNECTSTPTVH